MKDRRSPWLLSAVLMLGGGVALGISTYLSWLPCRGSMLTLTPFDGLGLSTGDFTGACSELMDSYSYFGVPQSQQPGATLAGLIGLVLLALAWVPIAVSAGRSWPLRLVALLPSAFGVTVVAGGFAEFVGLIPLGSVPYELLAWFFDPLALIAVVIVLAGSLSRRDLAATVLVGWATATAGIGHVLIDFTAMVAFSEADWDVPPGSGYLTAAWTVASAVLIMIITRRRVTTPDAAAESSLVGIGA